MPSKSEKQRKFFGAAMGAKKGKKGVKGPAKKAAKKMSKKEIKKFLKTEKLDGNVFDRIYNESMKSYIVEKAVPHIAQL